MRWPPFNTIIELPRYHRPDLARQRVSVPVRNPKALHRRNAVTLMVRDYPPPSSGGDLFTSQHPDRQEMRSDQYPSGGTGRIQRTRAVSMHVSALLSAPSHLSRRLNRTASPAIHSGGHQHVGTQPVSTTGQIPAGRWGGRSRFPLALQGLLPCDFRYAVRPRSMRHYYYSTILHRFRILVVGKVSVVYHTGRRPSAYTIAA